MKECRGAGEGVCTDERCSQFLTQVLTNSDGSVGRESAGTSSWNLHTVSAMLPGSALPATTQASTAMRRTYIG